jgi:predicted DNA-binding transcriptional regulator AlpA
MGWCKMAAIDHRDEDIRMLRIKQVLELFPISRVSLYRLIRERKFPAPEKLGGVNLWSNQALREWRLAMKENGVKAPGRGKRKSSRDHSNLI